MLCKVSWLSLHAFFRCSWNIFRGWCKRIKSAITELYKNLSYATLNGANNFNFDAISDLIGRLSFSIKKSTLADRDRREKEDAKKQKK